MPPKEFPFGMGARYQDDPEDFTYRHADLVRSAADAFERPPKVDNRHLFAHVPVWNQGKEGACTGMALAAALSVIEGVELSPRFAFEGAKDFDEWPGDTYDGSSLRGACKSANHIGVCEHPLWPFLPFQLGGKSPEADDNAKTHMLLRYERLNSLGEVLHAIWTEGFCIFTIDVHTGWIRPTKHARIRYSPTYYRRGLHAVVGVGYDEMVGYLLLRNSWRDDWGDEGYGWLKFDDYTDNGYDAWVLYIGESCQNGSG